MRARLSAWLFGVALRLCERLEPPTRGAASSSGDVLWLRWYAHSVPSVSGRSIFPFLVLSVQRGGRENFVTLSPAQAQLFCAGGEQLIKEQMTKFGHTAPLDWDTTGSKFNFVSGLGEGQ